jgi:cytoskeletal protein CcmA (bactofilin family)
MWGSKKDATEVEPVAETTIPAIARPDPPAGAAAATGVSVIAAGCVVNGSVTATGNLQIEGTVSGDVRCATLTVGRAGAVTGHVTAETATIRGKVDGDVRARTIQLAGTGVINGDLTHAVLIIEEGGEFEGRSKRLADPLADAPQIEAAGASSGRKAKGGKEAAPAAPAAGEAADEGGSALAKELGEGFAAS